MSAVQKGAPVKDSAYFLARFLLENARKFMWIGGVNAIGCDVSSGRGTVCTLRVYDSRYAIAGHPEYIHSHSYGFHSRVVAGVMAEQRFVKVDDSDPRGEIYRSRRFGTDYKPIGGVENILLRGAPVIEHPAGEEYCIGQGELHRAFPLDGTVTVIRRNFGEITAPSIIAWRAEAADQDYSTKAEPVNPAILADIVLNSLATWF